MLLKFQLKVWIIVSDIKLIRLNSIKKYPLTSYSKKVKGCTILKFLMRLDNP